MVYIPTGGKVRFARRKAKARFAVEWFDPATGKTTAGQPVAGGADRELTAPFAGDARAALHRSV